MTKVVDQDGSERRRFERDAREILSPEQLAVIMDDEYHVATVLANDPDENRAGKLVLLAEIL